MERNVRTGLRNDLLCFFFTILLFAVLLDVFKTKQLNTYEKQIFVLLSFFLILMSGLRLKTGYDFESYKQIFESVKQSSWNSLFSSGWGLVVEPGYMILNYLCKWMPFQLYIFLISTVSVFIKVLFIYKISNNLIMCLFIYYSMYFCLYDMGVIRQGFAIGLLLWAFYYYIEGKRGKTAIYIILASFFHSSSIIFFSIYLIKDKVYKFRWYAVTLISILIFSFGGIIEEIIYKSNITFIQNKYWYYINQLADNDESIVNSIIKRLIVFLLLLIIVDWNAIKRSEKKYKIALNVYFASIIISIMFYMLPIIGGRGTGALQFMQVFLLPIIADKRYIRNNLNKARLIGILIIIVLSFYSLYTVINSHSYLPYHSILS